MSFLLWKRTHGQLQLEGTWDPILAAEVGGQSHHSCHYYPLSRPFRLARRRSRHDPMYVLVCSVLRLWALEPSGSD